MSSIERVLELADADPKAAMELLEQMESLVVRPHAAQQQVLQSTARMRVLNCGRRWGKTKLAAHIALKKARKKNQMIWWVAPTYKVVKRGYKELLRQLPKDVLASPAPPDTNFDAGRSVILKFKNGTNIEFYSAERPEGMLGEGVDFAVLDEAALMPENIWAQVVRPTLMDRQGGAIMISTPRGRNWFNRAWKRGQSSDPKDADWGSWTFPSWTNEFLPEGEIEEMRNDLPHLLFQQEVEAKFIAAGSNIFVIPDEIVQEELVEPEGHVVLGIDLARTTDYTVIYGANARTRKNCYYKRWQDVTWPRQRRMIIRATKDVLKRGATGVTLCIDSTGVGDPMVEELEELGFDVIGLNFTTWKDKMVKLLAKDIEDGRSFLLTEQLDEFEQYELHLTEKGRASYSAPSGENDDAVAAKMLQHWAIVNEGVPDATIIDGVSTDSINRDEPTHPDDDEMPDDEDWGDFDWDDEPEGVVVTETIYGRSANDMMNDPSVWN
jgi:hypothetical protein